MTIELFDADKEKGFEQYMGWVSGHASYKEKACERASSNTDLWPKPRSDRNPNARYERDFRRQMHPPLCACDSHPRRASPPSQYPQYEANVFDLEWLYSSWEAYWAYLAPWASPLEPQGRMARPSSGWHMARLALGRCDKVNMFGFSLASSKFHCALVARTRSSEASCHCRLHGSQRARRRGRGCCTRRESNGRRSGRELMYAADSRASRFRLAGPGEGDAGAAKPGVWLHAPLRMGARGLPELDQADAYALRAAPVRPHRTSGSRPNMCNAALERTIDDNEREGGTDERAMG